MHHAHVLHQRVADGRVVDQPLHGFAHLGLGEVGVLHVQADVEHGALGRGRGADVLVRAQRGKVLWRQVARDVDVALLQQQALRRGLLHVAVDHAAHFGLGAKVVVVALEREDLVGAPLADLERTRARVVRLEPGQAHVAVDFVGQQQLAVHDGRDVGRQAVQHEGRRVGLVGFQRQRQRTGLPDPVLDVVLAESELGQDEGRALVEQHGALQREHHVFGAQRIARGEFQVGLELETVGLAVARHGPRLGQVTLQLGGVGNVEADQPVVGVAHDLAGRNLERLGRVHGDDVVERKGQHQRVLGRGGLNRRQRRSQAEKRGQGDAERAARQGETGGRHGVSVQWWAETNIPSCRLASRAGVTPARWLRPRAARGPQRRLSWSPRSCSPRWPRSCSPRPLPRCSRCNSRWCCS